MEFSLFATRSRLALGHTQLPTQCAPEALNQGRPRCEANHSPPFSAEIKNAWSYTSTSLRGTYLSTEATRPERLSGPRSLISTGYRGLFPWGKSGQGVKLTTHLHLVPRSMNEWSYNFTSPICLHGVVLS
jgi:hypothetical protein